VSEFVQIGSLQAKVDTCVRQPSASRSVLWLQGITVLWMLLELAVSAYAAWTARSPAMLAFGADSLVEVLSALVVLLQFTPVFTLSPKKAARLAGLLLFALALIVAGLSATSLALRLHPQVSYAGIGITLAALIAMPVLARLKRSEARRTHNAALAADAVQSAACAYLALIALAGLVANAVFHLPWLDSVAALAAIPVLLNESRSVWQGHTCGCC
jgi:divalent metal cation (Fe/Co/Zn/Cd) transporter